MEAASRAVPEASPPSATVGPCRKSATVGPCRKSATMPPEVAAGSSASRRKRQPLARASRRRWPCRRKSPPDRLPVAAVGRAVPVGRKWQAVPCIIGSRAGSSASRRKRQAVRDRLPVAAGSSEAATVGRFLAFPVSFAAFPVSFAALRGFSRLFSHFGQRRICPPPLAPRSGAFSRSCLCFTVSHYATHDAAQKYH